MKKEYNLSPEKSFQQNTVNDSIEGYGIENEGQEIMQDIPKEHLFQRVTKAEKERAEGKDDSKKIIK